MEYLLKFSRLLRSTQRSEACRSLRPAETHLSTPRSPTGNLAKAFSSWPMVKTIYGLIERRLGKVRPLQIETVSFDLGFGNLIEERNHVSPRKRPHKIVHKIPTFKNPRPTLTCLSGFPTEFRFLPRPQLSSPVRLILWPSRLQVDVTGAGKPLPPQARLDGAIGCVGKRREIRLHGRRTSPVEDRPRRCGPSRTRAKVRKKPVLRFTCDVDVPTSSAWSVRALLQPIRVRQSDDLPGGSAKISS